MSASRAALSAALLLAALAPAVAHAGDGFLGKARPKLTVDDCPVQPAVELAVRKAQSDEHYDRGAVLYLQGDYDGAIAEITAAYCLVPEPAYLKDLGQAYERKVEYELAVAYLERFVVDASSDPGQAADRRNASARIQVLGNLRSQIKVATDPPGALVTVAGTAGVGGAERANSDKPITVTAGDYQMTIEAPGFEPIRQELTIGIGKPYSFSFRMIPRQGRVRIQTVPGDARIVLDDRVVGIGSYEGPADLGVHHIDVDASGFRPARAELEVVDGEVATTSIQLVKPPESGRWLMIIGSTVLGAYAGTVFGLVTEVDAADAGSAAVAGLGIGLVAGAIGGYVLVPGDIGHGTSSFLLTTAAAGIVNGTLLGTASTRDQVTSTLSLGGAAIGAGTAAILLQRFDVSDGQAALYNSGLVWGVVSGSLFATIFDADAGRTSLAITLAGTNLGLITGAVLANRYQVSRKRVIYIDLAGAAGLVAGLALQNAASSAGSTGSSNESRSHFTLAGMAVGLGIGTFLTRNLDAPRLSTKFQPTVMPVRDAAGATALTVGFGGSL